MSNRTRPEDKLAYALVTPARNEETNLPFAGKGILDQTIPPRLWVIVDDGSTDRTPEIVRNLKTGRNWILGPTLPTHERDIRGHYAEVCKKGFDFAVSYLSTNEMDYHFLGLLDADTVVEPTYFEKLMAEFEKDPKLGLASGCLFYEKEGRLVPEASDIGSPRGTGRLWTKSCFFETGGYLVSRAPPDVISNVRAKLLDYRTRQFRSIVAVQRRPTSTADGAWVGYQEKGRSWHYMNAHPILVLMNVIHFTAGRPRYRGAAFLLGYTEAFLRRDEKIEDQEIREYFWKVRPMEVLRSVFAR